MYLHEDKELFYEIITNAAAMQRKAVAIVEKDYYVTMILKLLTKKSENCVFKGGTSLSKGFGILSRFSEDIDITFTEHIGEARRKKLKYNVMKWISDELSLPIANWEKIESDKDLNTYIFQYEPLNQIDESGLSEGVKVETALASYSFPTEKHMIDNCVRQYLAQDNEEIIEEYGLDLFEMNLQSINRTFIDKVFALCDYYMQGKSKRYSRHIYNISKLKPYIQFDDEFRALVKEVRNHRMTMKICPSADDAIDIPKMVHEFCASDFYKQDYADITSYFLDDKIEYENAVTDLLSVIDSDFF